MKHNILKTISFVFVTFMFAQSLTAQSQAVAPTNPLKMGTKKALLQYMGSIQVDSNLVLPIRSIDDTLNAYAKTGNIFYDTKNKHIVVYNGTSFSSFPSSKTIWTLGGNVIAGGDSAIGTKDNVSLTFLQNNLRKIVLSKDGYLGINNIDPKYHLDVNGIIKSRGAIFERTLSSALPSTYSDSRFKNNVQPINNSLQKILELKGVTYFFKTKEFADKGFSDKIQVGLIAQEVEKVLPEIVTNESDGYKSVSYTMLIPYLIEATKQQNQTIQELKSIVEKQQKQIDALLQNKK